MNSMIYIRTHYVNHTIEELFDLWSQVLPGRVRLLIDETAGVHDAGTMPKVSYSLDTLAAMGLPDLPKGKAMWHAGDYTMAALAPIMEPDEFAIVVENDAVPVLHDIEGWRDIVSQLAEGEIAFLNFNRRHPEWFWRNNLDAIYHKDEIWGCFMMVMGFTHVTATRMMARRRQIADEIAKGVHTQWPHVEAFVATEAKRMALRLVNLDRLIPDLNQTCKVSDPYWWYAQPKGIARNTILHPVMQDRGRFLNKIENMIVRKLKVEYIASRLAPILPLSPAEHTRFTSLVQEHPLLESLDPLLKPANTASSGS